jgi:hypothetical protein
MQGQGNAPAGATAPGGQSGKDRQAPSRAQEGGKDKQGQAQQGSQGQRQKEQTTGQAPQGGAAKDADKGQQTQREQGGKEQTPAQREEGRGTAETPRDQRQGQGTQRQEGQGNQAQQKGQGGKAAMTTEQRTKIRETVLGGNAPRASNVNFSVSVGTTVPTTVRVVEVPSVIIEIHPEYRGHMYFVVNDEIIIVDRDHRIVAVLTV